MPSNVVFVLVHGAWIGSEDWELVTPLLKERGYESAAVDLPSTFRPPPLQTMDPDTEAVRKEVEAHVSKGKDVVVVMHSYGGYPGSEAMKHFIDNNDGANGRGRVIRLVYLSAFIPTAGISFLDSMGGKPHPDWIVSGDIFESGHGIAKMFPDMPREEAEKFVRNVRPMAYGTMGTKPTVEPYRNIPAAYWHAVLDPFPLDYQKAMVAAASERAPGMFDLTVEVPCGHMGPYTVPDKVADFLVKTATTAK